MISLQNHINSLNFSTQLSVVKNLIDKAQAKTTFWGSRVIEVNGFTGSIYLTDITRKITNTAYQRSDADDLTQTERVDGLDIIKKLQKCYQTTDAQIKTSNFFTKALSWLREFSFTPYTERFYLEDFTGSHFLGYSPTKFFQTFGGTFGSGIAKYDHPASQGSFGPPLRIVAKEDFVRGILV